MDNEHIEEHHGSLVVASELNGDHSCGHGRGYLTLDGIPDRQLSPIASIVRVVTYTMIRVRRLSVSFQPDFDFQSP